MAEIFYTAAAVLASSGTAAVVIFGLSSWLGKVWAARILEQDRQRYSTELARLSGDIERANRQLQGTIDKTIFVHRLHFETEFRALCDVWQRVSKLRNAMAVLRPEIGLVPRDQTEEQEQAQLNARFKVFADALVEAQDAVDENRPFLTEDIHTALMAAIQAANAEYISISIHPKATTFDWHERGQKNRGAMLVSSNRVVDLIRSRLQRVALVPH